MYPTGESNDQNMAEYINDLYNVTGELWETNGLILLNAPMPEQIFLHISSILISKVNLSSRSTPKHLFETTDETTLLFMIMLLYKSPTLLVKFCLDPMTISLVLEGWDWSLFTFNQSVTFSKSELISLASSTESCEEEKIWVSSACIDRVILSLDSWVNR